jgi:hypothetical protein
MPDGSVKMGIVSVKDDSKRQDEKQETAADVK